MSRTPSPTALLTVPLIGACAAGASLARESSLNLVATIRNPQRAGAKCLALPSENLDEPAVEHLFATRQPAVVILCAAERRSDVCERDPGGARAINVVAPVRIGAPAARYGAWTLGISTDYVFDGKAAPYPEDTAPNPLNIHGRAKLGGAAALLAASPLSCVLRLPLLFGPVVDWSESAVTSLELAPSSSTPRRTRQTSCAARARNFRKRHMKFYDEKAEKLGLKSCGS
jgi:dTDP-4-dehydrorhamnose reductase